MGIITIDRHACIGMLTIGMVVFLCSGDGASSYAGGMEPKVIQAEDSVVRFAEEIEIPARATGVIAGVQIAINQSVRKGVSIAKLDDRDLLIQREKAQLRIDAAVRDANDEIESNYASAVLEEAKTDLDASRRLQKIRSGAVSQSELRRMELAVQRAKLGVARADRDRSEAKTELRVRQSELRSIDEQISALEVSSTIDGIVLQVHKQPGEWVEAGQPIARIASIDRLHIHALVSLVDISPQACRRGIVEVSWRDVTSGEPKRLSGFVDSVDPEVLRGGRVRVHAEVKNYLESGKNGAGGDWMLKPGMPVEMKIRIAGATPDTSESVRAASNVLNLMPAVTGSGNELDNRVDKR